MKRKIIRINEELCDGCGLCASACHEGAIAIIDGTAKLVSETYCDGLGACIGECPRDAITIEERDAAAFDGKAVANHLAQPTHQPEHPAHHASPPPAGEHTHGNLPCGCPGTAARTLKPSAHRGAHTDHPAESALGQWPIQLRLVNPAMPFLRDADLLICADCVPFAVPDFHQRYLAGHAIAVACPKLDDFDDIVERLTAIFSHARPRSVTVLRMEVPCCGGLAQAAHQALENAGVDIPIEVHIVRIEDGSTTIQQEHSHSTATV